MYLAETSPTTATLDADNSLLRAGLERAAHLANIEVVSDSDTATLALRSAGSGRPHPRLDVMIDLDRVVLSMSEQPSDASWNAIYNLLSQLAGDLPSDPDGSNRHKPPR